MRYKKYLCLGLLSCLLLSGCQSTPAKNPAVQVIDTQDVVELDQMPEPNDSTISLGNQLDMPKEGEEVAILHTNQGDIKIRLFPQEAPKAVYNFKKLALQGYYDGLTFHRVIEDFMIQAGDPNGDGSGGESIWKESFDDEFSSKLVNLKGALSMANSGSNTNGSQFFINQAGPIEASYWESMQANYDQLKDMNDQEKQMVQNYYGYTFMNMDLVTDAYKELYRKQGGNPSLDGAYNAFDPQRGHTVFGQVYEGMDIVDQIAAVQTDDNDKPLEDIVIEKVEIIPYSA